MKVLAITLLVVGLISKTYGLNCFTCTTTNINGESNDGDVCVTTTTTGTSPTLSSTCAADSTGSIKYCRTQFTITDSVITAVARGCVASDSDHDANTAAVPGNNRCVSVLDASGNPTDTTNCYYGCTTDDCNSLTTTSIVKCSTDCNAANSGGSCDYITGTCVCTSSFSGSDCTTAVTATSSVQRKCVQCNSETDTGCATSTTSVDCPGTETYCSTATSNIYAGDTVVRTVTTRGCTSTFKAVDECSFTNIYTDSPISDTPPGYKEFTCFSTCDTDGCNTNTADGIINGNEAVTLQCVQCSDLTGDNSCDPDKVAGQTAARSTCPSGSTHCKTTVVYLTSDRADLSNNEAVPSSRLVSVVRECATETGTALTSECTDSTIGSLSLKKVTCVETCQGDGCNTGWPARPMCIQCTSSSADYADGYDECVHNPPEATVCDNPFDAYCYIEDKGIERHKIHGISGYPRRMTRGCSHYDRGTGCSSEKLRETEMETCNRTCTTDGCNVGSGGTMPFQTFLAIMVPTVLGWIAQIQF